MAPTNAKFIERIICEGFLIIALGAVTFKNIEWNSLLEWWISMTKMFLKYLELKNLEVEVSRVEESRS
jgi:hypothetical protein